MPYTSIETCTRPKKNTDTTTNETKPGQKQTFTPSNNQTSHSKRDSCMEEQINVFRHRKCTKQTRHTKKDPNKKKQTLQTQIRFTITVPTSTYAAEHKKGHGFLGPKSQKTQMMFYLLS